METPHASLAALPSVDRLLQRGEAEALIASHGDTIPIAIGKRLSD